MRRAGHPYRVILVGLALAAVSVLVGCSQNPIKEFIYEHPPRHSTFELVNTEWELLNINGQLAPGYDPDSEFWKYGYSELFFTDYSVGGDWTCNTHWSSYWVLPAGRVQPFGYMMMTVVLCDDPYQGVVYSAIMSGFHYSLVDGFLILYSDDGTVLVFVPWPKEE